MFLTPLILTLLFICILWLSMVYWKINHNLPPGPFGLPGVGYYPFLSEKHFLDFARLAKRYGAVFSFRTTGNKLIVVLNGIEAIKDVMLKRSEEFIGRPMDSNWAEWISNGMGKNSKWCDKKSIAFRFCLFSFHRISPFGFCDDQIEPFFFLQARLNFFSSNLIFHKSHSTF